MIQSTYERDLEAKKAKLREELDAINKMPPNDIIDGAISGSTVELLAASKDYKVNEKIVANQFAGTIHPVAKLPRVVLWLLKLEEQGLRDGNIKALEILLDRAFGKVTESMVLGVGQFQGSNDGELLDELKRIRNKGV